MAGSTQVAAGDSLRAADPAPVLAAATKGGGRAYLWALSKDVAAELRITGTPLTKAEADRLRQYLDLTISALVAETE